MSTTESQSFQTLSMWLFLKIKITRYFAAFDLVVRRCRHVHENLMRDDIRINVKKT